MIPRVGTPPKKGENYTIRAGVYVILPRGKDVLLTSQYEDEPDIQLPGGGVDPGEQPRVALYREVIEETGWSISAPRRLGAFRRFVFMPEYDLWALKICHVYVARPVRQLCNPTETDHTPLWLPISQAIHAVGNQGDQMFLARYARNPYPV